VSEKKITGEDRSINNNPVIYLESMANSANSYFEVLRQVSIRFTQCRSLCDPFELIQQVGLLFTLSNGNPPEMIFVISKDFSQLY